MTLLRAFLAVAAYGLTLIAANVLTARYGLVPVLPGVLVTAGTYAAGLSFLLRDVVQDTAGRAAAVGVVLGGTWVSYDLAGPELALASGVAFLLAELLDLAVYTPLRRRGWARAVLASNTAGSVLDSVVFLALAPFPLTAAAVGAQTFGKVVIATGIPVLAVLAVREVRRRALPLGRAGTGRA